MSTTANTLYEHAGGDEGLHRLELPCQSESELHPIRQVPIWTW